MGQRNKGNDGYLETVEGNEIEIVGGDNLESIEMDQQIQLVGPDGFDF